MKHMWHRTDFCSQCGVSYEEYADTKIQCRDDVVPVNHLIAEKALGHLFNRVADLMKEDRGN